jgi:hypothetical protein
LGELENHNLILRLHNPQLLQGIYGMKRSYINLAIHLDEPEAFRNALLKAI